ncbi:MAG: primase [Clostridia bacterium]|jgi:DNA primase|nr:primase [Clostridia bacterium]
MYKIKGQELDINYLEELTPYVDSLKRVSERGGKLLACSPFRDERRPSFAVNLEDGMWIDSGSTDDRWKKGNFTRLLSYFMNVSFEEVEDYLVEKYGEILADTDALKLTLSIEIDKPEPIIVPFDELKKYQFRHGYLEGRGISEKVQKAFKIGFDRGSKAITLPWMDVKGKVINIKYRSVSDKRFWYMSGGQALKSHVYGLNFIYRGNYNEVYVVEAEIDALYLWSHGIPAIAFGGANITDVQHKLIYDSPIEQLVIATDNDTVGQKFKRQIAERFAGVAELKELLIPPQYKDVNEIPPEQISEVVKNTSSIHHFLWRLSC